MMYYADHHGFPIVTFIDTPGAYADLKSEELGQVLNHASLAYLFFVTEVLFAYFFLLIDREKPLLLI